MPTYSIRVVVTDYIEADLEWERQELNERGIGFACHQLKQAPVNEVIEKTRDADIVVVNMVKITPEVVDAWNNVKVVIRHGAGYDNVNVQALTDRGILLEYIPDYCQHEVAEHAVALLLSCARKTIWSRKVLDDSVARGEWDFSPIVPMYRLHGATAGVVGCGRIGSLVYEKLKGLGMNVLVCDPYLNKQRLNRLGVKPVSLEAVCRQSDYITVHTPLNDETRYMINAQVLSWMKPSAYLINTSRGGMVQIDDLARALRDNAIAGAAIDVFEKEPPAKDYPLLNLDNAIVTPHLSWYSKDAEQTIREKILDVIYMYCDGTLPRIAVNPEVLMTKARA